MSTERKPDKPYPDFPLYAHGSGQWAKTIRGRKHYFGPWDNWKAALDEYVKHRDALYAGRAIGARGVADVRYLLNAFLTSKEVDAQNGVILQSTFQEYFRTCTRVAACLGKDTPVTTLGPRDFERLRQSFNALAVTTQKNEVARCRVLFNWAYESGTVEAPLRYKMLLKAPPARLLKRAANERKRLLSSGQVLALLNAASGPMRAAILLGVNCGLGGRDAALLEAKHLDLKGGWLQYPRPKTEVDRRCKLWPETIAALRSLPKRTGQVFQGNRGQSLASDSGTSIPHRFEAVAKAAKVTGYGFYCLRHTYRTIAARSKDREAVAKTMGHSIGTIEAVYTHDIDEDRLANVADIVRSWLYGDSANALKILQT